MDSPDLSNHSKCTSYRWMLKQTLKAFLIPAVIHIQGSECIPPPPTAKQTNLHTLECWCAATEIWNKEVWCMMSWVTLISQNFFFFSKCQLHKSCPATEHEITFYCTAILAKLAGTLQCLLLFFSLSPSLAVPHNAKADSFAGSTWWVKG